MLDALSVIVCVAVACGYLSDRRVVAVPREQRQRSPAQPHSYRCRSTWSDDGDDCDWSDGAMPEMATDIYTDPDCFWLSGNVFHVDDVSCSSDFGSPWSSTDPCSTLADDDGFSSSFSTFGED